MFTVVGRFGGGGDDHIYLEMKIGNVSNMDLGVYSCGKVGGGGGGTTTSTWK